MKGWNPFKKEPEATSPPEEKKTTGGMTNDPEIEGLRAEAEAEAAGDEYVPLGAGVGVSNKGPSAAPSDAGFLKGVFKMTFDAIAKRAGDHWKLSEDELSNLSEAAAPVINRYVPAVLDKYGAEIMLAYTVGMIVIPRLTHVEKVEVQEAA